ncbi:hypothetical protein Tsubulata_012248 [Turnera subulata]|uniref:S1 motif domain-containing protein n=1 Tax=Turnera subulata TaxID=218843 RepID=A0A9Q0JLT6_9ROSI|nr:hypothetical protein Tsubulata_012248 [Turnera subulata]
MQAFLQPNKSISFLSSLLPPPLTASNFALLRKTTQESISFYSLLPKPLAFSKNWRTTHISFCSQDDASDDFSSSQLPGKEESDRIQVVSEELELLSKPSPVATDDGLAAEADKRPEKPDKEKALAPFLKFFKPRDSSGQIIEEEGDFGVEEQKNDVGFEQHIEATKVNVEYYEPKPGDLVVGVVVSGNANKIDVNIGADLLGTMLTKELLPLYGKELDYLLCDLEEGAESFMVEGKMGIVKDEVAVSGGPGPGKPIVETGTVLFAEVLGRTLSGRPLLSARRLFRRIAWRRVRQIKELNEPIEVNITEWNTGGLLTRIEGLRAFLPKLELMKKVKNFKELKENEKSIEAVNVVEPRVEIRDNDKLELVDFMLVLKFIMAKLICLLSFEANSGLLHISNISQTRVSSVSDFLNVDERVKVLVVKSMFPNNIALSIADLESEPGLFVSSKERVFAEAEEMAKKYRQKLASVQKSWKSEKPPESPSSLDDEATLYSNWKWFKFERE